jgi:uncharacterized protein YqhQ
MADKFRYGGQAVMEGVMMRGQKWMATVVRRPDGTFAKEVKPLQPIYTGRWRRTPMLRGVIALLEAIVLGTQVLMFSANVALEDTEDKNKPKEQKKSNDGLLWLMMVVAFALAAGIFFVTPLFLTRLLVPNSNSFVFTLVEGVVRLVIFLVYLWLVAFMPDIRRVFSYHGAEHKTIFAYEAGKPLCAESCTPFSTAHPRCGTAFLLMVMIIAMVVFGVVGKHALWIMVLSRILLLPVIAALSYEFTQWGARHLRNPFVKALMAPGLWLQKLTTRQPDERQLEVAIMALTEVLVADGVITREDASPSNQPL